MKRPDFGTLTRKIKPALWQNIRKGIVCGLLLFIAAIPVVFLNSIYGYLPLLTLALTILLSRGYLAVLKRTLSFEEKSDLDNCKRKTEIEFKVEMKNAFFLVFPKVEIYFYVSDLFGADDAVTQSVLTLAPKETRTFEFTVRFDHIGSYTAGLKKVKIHDLLGLFSCTLENPKEYRVNVAPRIFDVERLQISNTSLTESQQMIVPTVVDGTDYAGVREYVWGDPIKLIHWKLSARTETYMTKQFESYGNVGLAVILDFFSPEYSSETMMEIFDTVVETGLSIGNYAQEQGLEYEIIYSNKNNEKKKFNTGHYQDFVELLQDMPKISSTEGERTGIELLTEEGNARYSQGNIAFCTANITNEMAGALLELKMKKKNPLLFAIVPDSLEGEEREAFLKPLKTLDSGNIIYYILSSAEELGGGGAD